MATPQAGQSSQIVTAGNPVQVAPAGALGGLITNPLSAADQGLANTEVLYVDQVGPCATCAAGGTIFALQAGDTWALIPGSTLPVNVNALSQGHKFSVTWW